MRPIEENRYCKGCHANVTKTMYCHCGDNYLSKESTYSESELPDNQETPMNYKHLLPALYEFIGDAFKWRATVGSILPESLEEETLQAIHKSEVAEYIHAVNHEHSAFNISKELADMLWTGTFLKCVSAPDLQDVHRNIVDYIGVNHYLLEEDHLQHLDPLVLKAVSISNWSKICNVLGPPIHPNVWASHLDKNRFLDVDLLVHGNQAILVGTDYQNPKTPQRNKVLKPKGYRSAEQVYRELKEKEGRDD